MGGEGGRGGGDIGKGSGDGGDGDEVKNKSLRRLNRDVCFVAGAGGRPGGECGDIVLRADCIETGLSRFRAGGSGETWQIGGDGGETETC